MFIQQTQKWKAIVHFLYNQKIRCHLRFQIYCAMHFLGPAKKSKMSAQRQFCKTFLINVICFMSDNGFGSLRIKCLPDRALPRRKSCGLKNCLSVCNQIVRIVSVTSVGELETTELIFQCRFLPKTSFGNIVLLV